jgi:hypothetical protein
MEHFGTDPHKLHRKESPDTSVEAAHSVDTTALEQMVYEAIREHPQGCIADDLLSRFNRYPYSSITARFRGLIDKGFIEVIGTRKGRSGRSQRVMIVRHH